jgi:hypothetical protein
MTKTEAHAHLDRLREGHPMPVALTTQALLITGDIPRISHPTLCFDSNESTDDRGGEIQNQGIESRFSYSRYLGSTTNKGT